MKVLRSEIERCERRIVDIQKNVTIHNEAAELLIAGAKVSRQRTIGFVENVVTAALQTVMQDPTLRFAIETKQRRNTLEADYLVEWKSRGITIRRPPMRAKGGCLWSIISTALHFLFLLRTKPRRQPILVLDEPAEGVNGDNVVRFSKWIKAMAVKFKIQVLLISHREEMMEAADKVYRVRKGLDGVAKLLLEE